MTPEDDNWLVSIEAPYQIKTDERINWDDESDVLIVGLGGAGVACALQALESGLSVTALDKFEGGGATKASGGVIYAGGGTSIQKEAGVEDTPENMFNYLKLEVGEIVSDKTLHDFCEQSAETIEWMRGHDVDLRPTLWPEKTSYPAPEYFLYHSDNSLVGSYKEKAKPAARGHRGYVPVEQGRKATNLGGSLFDPLRDSARKMGMKESVFTEASQLILDPSGEVLGLKAHHFGSEKALEDYQKLRARAHRIMQIFPPIIPGSKFFFRRALKLLAKAAELEAQREAIYLRARHGVCLSAGGFVFNSKMLAHYAPKYKRAYPLGTDGDQGSGIRLGQSVGGAINNMDRMTAWRFINPPLSFARGAIVNSRAERFINEMVYGATLGVEMVENQDGEAWLILDKPLAKQALQDVSGKKALNFQKALAQLNLRFGAKKAKSLDELAAKISVPPDRLNETIDRYNLYAQGLEKDPFDKSKSECAALTSPPFYAINIGLTAKLFPCPALTLGGLQIDEATGQVLDEKAQPISKLYAAGRNAIGVASWNYVSGLSIADGIYSGRRAARAIAKSSKAALVRE